jgi:hypothetical protein
MSAANTAAGIPFLRGVTYFHVRQRISLRKRPRRPEHGPTPAEMELLDRIEARLEDTSPSYRRCRFPAASKRGGDGTRRCDMIPTVAVCA